MDFKLDRTSFKIQSHEEEEASKVFLDKTPRERLEIAAYLISVAYGYCGKEAPKMDKTAFSTRKR